MSLEAKNSLLSLSPAQPSPTQPSPALPPQAWLLPGPQPSFPSLVWVLVHMPDLDLLEIPKDNFTDANFIVAVAALKDPEDPTLALSSFFFLPPITTFLLLRAPIYS